MGAIFMKKIQFFFKLGPQSVGRFHQMVACQAAKKGLMKKKYNFEFKIQIQQGSTLYKKIALIKGYDSWNRHYSPRPVSVKFLYICFKVRLKF
jgi:hypothetical protein